MKKLSTLLLLLALALCLCATASADAVEYYCGTWYMTSIISGETAIDPTTLGIEMSMSLSADGTCTLTAMEHVEAGTWAVTESGISTTDADGVIDVYTLTSGQLTATLEGMTVVFTHEDDLNATYVNLRANLTPADFDGLWRLAYLEMAEGFIDKADMGIDMTIALENGAGWCEMTYDGTTEKYNLACTLEEAEDVGTIMYATFKDVETGEALPSGLMLMLYEDGVLVWYTVSEDIEFYYCFEQETAE